jgi:hypothetical protein
MKLLFHYIFNVDTGYKNSRMTKNDNEESVATKTSKSGSLAIRHSGKTVQVIH